MKKGFKSQNLTKIHANSTKTDLCSMYLDTATSVHFTVLNTFNKFLFIYIFYWRYGCFQALLKQIEAGEGGIEKFSRGYEKFGIHVNSDNSITCHEWAPLAQGLFLKGDFSKNLEVYECAKFTSCHKSKKFPSLKVFHYIFCNKYGICSVYSLW